MTGTVKIVSIILSLFAVGLMSIAAGLSQISRSEPIVEPTALPSPTALTPPSPPPTLGADTEAVVVSVTDGDTFKVKLGDEVKTVRLIGIDTPESTRQRECFGKEASDRLKQLLMDQTVKLEKDISETDRFGRLLRYVYVNGVFINELLVAEGFATAVTYPPDVKYQDTFRNTEYEARRNGLGLWRGCKR